MLYLLSIFIIGIPLYLISLSLNYKRKTLTLNNFITKTYDNKLYIESGNIFTFIFLSIIFIIFWPLAFPAILIFIYQHNIKTLCVKILGKIFPQ